MVIEAVGSPSPGRTVVTTVQPLAFGSTREVSEATLVSEEVDQTAFYENIPLAPTLETATVLAEHDFAGPTKRDSNTTDPNRDRVGEALPDRHVNFLVEEDSNLANELDYLHRRDREYHRNIASNIGAAEMADRELAASSAVHKLARVPSNPTVVSNMPSSDVAGTRNQWLPLRSGVSEKGRMCPGN